MFRVGVLRAPTLLLRRQFPSNVFVRFRSTLGDAVNQTPRKFSDEQPDPLDNLAENVERLRLTEKLERTKVEMEQTEETIKHLESAPQIESVKIEPEASTQEEDKDAIKLGEDTDSDDIKGQAASLAAQAHELGKEPPNISQQINEEIHRQFKDLPSSQEARKLQWAKKISDQVESLHLVVLTATRALNDVTGYSVIEKLKQLIDKLEDDLKAAKQQVKECKLDYGDAIQLRLTSQREINELLTRKHNWSSKDLERFTDLYRNDHTNELREKEAAENLNEAELKVDAIQLKLTQLILTRYHEEQIWSDKIRRALTWGTWVIMGINLLLFIIATFFVEPWKRKRLVDAFEAKVKQTMTAVETGDEKIVQEIANLKVADTSAANEVKDFVNDVVHFADTTPSVEAEYEANQKQLAKEKEANEQAVQAQKDAADRVPGVRGAWESFKLLLVQARYDLLLWWAHVVQVMLTTVELRKLDIAGTVSMCTLIGGALGSYLTRHFKLT